MKRGKYIIYALFILTGIGIIAFATLNDVINQSTLLNFGWLWLTLSIAGSFLDARFGQQDSKNGETA